MFNNYVKIAFRNLMKQKIYSLINITGLAIGMACCIVIFLFVQYEFSFDRFHDKADRIYRLCDILKITDREVKYSTVPSWALQPLLDDLPEIENAVRLNLNRGTITLCPPKEPLLSSRTEVTAGW